MHIHSFFRKARGFKNRHGVSRVWFKQLFPFLSAFVSFFALYLQKKVMIFSSSFEWYKNILVKFFMMKRGRYNRPFLHFTAMGVLAIGVVLAPFLADTYPIFSAHANEPIDIATSAAKLQSIAVDTDVFQTAVSQKPRDKVLIYQVEGGDTISTIARKFGISTDTIRWTNDLSSDDLIVGQELKILPVTGVLHKVGKGDSVYTIAKKYDTNPQAIVDFPFNEFANPQTFSLVEGQMLVVPEGVMPSEKPAEPRQQFFATGPVNMTNAGFTWPLQGVISQFFAWYHPGIDIAAPIGSPIVAGQNGTVSEVYTSGWNGGYGIHVIISNTSGVGSLYAHMSGVNVGVGDTVTAGKTVVGWVGMTGRTTGPHLHFEVRTPAGNSNPLPFLQ